MASKKQKMDGEGQSWVPQTEFDDLAAAAADLRVLYTGEQARRKSCEQRIKDLEPLCGRGAPRGGNTAAAPPLPEEAQRMMQGALLAEAEALYASIVKKGGEDFRQVDLTLHYKDSILGYTPWCAGLLEELLLPYQEHKLGPSDKTAQGKCSSKCRLAVVW